MIRTKLTEDIHTLSSFRSNLSTYVKQIKKTQRPIVLTQNGKSAAILLDVNHYESLMDKIELLEELQKSSLDLKNGNVQDHKTLMKELKSRMKS